LAASSLLHRIEDPIVAAIENHRKLDHRKLERVWLDLDRAPKRAGIVARRSRAESAWCRAAQQLAQTKPSIAAGAASVFATPIEVGEMDRHEAVFDTDIASLPGMETVPPHSPIAKAA
jgi:hypothetical protein